MSLVSALGAEHPDTPCVSIDLDTVDAAELDLLWSDLIRPDAEDQIAYRGGRRFVSRLERASAIAVRFGEIRDQLSTVRARIDAAIQGIENVSRFLPFIEVPQGPADALAAFDERVARIDAAVADLRAGVGARAERVRAGATAVKTAVEGIQGVTDRIRTGLEDVRLRAQQANQAIDGYVWLVTIALLALVAYVAALNILVLLLTRRRKPAASVEGPPSTATPIEPS